jgi:hypothetical protein
MLVSLEKKIANAKIKRINNPLKFTIGTKPQGTLPCTRLQNLFRAKETVAKSSAQTGKSTSFQSHFHS